MSDSFEFDIGKISGQPKEGVWSQIFEKEEERGALFCILSTKTQEEEPATLGKEIFDNFSKNFFENAQAGGFDALDSALRATLADYNQVSLNLVVCVFLKEAIYLGLLGVGGVRIIRDEKIKTILPQKEAQVQVASGFTKTGDIIILTTKDFSTLVDFEKLSSLILEKVALAEVAESFAPKIHEAENQASLSACFIKLKGRKEEKKAVEENFEEVKEMEEKKGTIQPEIEEPKEEIQASLGHKTPLVSGLKTFITTKIGWLFSLISPRAIFVRGEESASGKKKIFLILALLVVVILVGNLIYQSRAKSARENQEFFDTNFSQASQKYQDYESALGQDSTQAKTILEEAKKLASQAQEKADKDEDKEKIEALLAKIDDALERLLGKKEIPGEVFFDLTVAKDGARGDVISVLGDDLLVCDKGSGTGYLVSVSDKSPQILFGGDEFLGLEGCQLGDGFASAFGSFGLMKVDTESKEASQTAEPDEEWEDIRGMGVFGTNIYLLDRGSSQIWKYTPTVSGYGRLSYFEGEQTEIGQAISMAIDAAIWILGEDGQVWKFLQGVKENFAVSGLPEEFAFPTEIFTDPDTENIYILDKGAGRVVVLDKSGKFINQLKSEAARDASSFAVAEGEKKIFLLAGEKIFSLEL